LHHQTILFKHTAFTVFLNIIDYKNMDERTTMNIPKYTIYPNRNHKIKRDIPSNDIESAVSIYDLLVEELGEEVFYYLDKLGATPDHNIILLSPIRHYIYSSTELKQVKTVINLIEINDTRTVKIFLHNFNRVLPMKCYFVGKFTDYKVKTEQVKTSNPYIIRHMLLMLHTFEHKIVPKIPVINYFQYLLNSRKLKYLTSKKMRKLLKNSGFHVVDIKQINGVSYFISQKVSHNQKAKSSSFFNFVNDFNTPY
jgi:hypothetical protein